MAHLLSCSLNPFKFKTEIAHVIKSGQGQNARNLDPCTVNMNFNLHLKFNNKTEQLGSDNSHSS